MAEDDLVYLLRRASTERKLAPEKGDGEAYLARPGRTVVRSEKLCGAEQALLSPGEELDR